MNNQDSNSVDEIAHLREVAREYFLGITRGENNEFARKFLIRKFNALPADAKVRLYAQNNRMDDVRGSTGEEKWVSIQNIVSEHEKATVFGTVKILNLVHEGERAKGILPLGGGMMLIFRTLNIP